MKRLALFVEGDTEQAFAERMLSEIANIQDVVIQTTTTYRTGSDSKIVTSEYSSTVTSSRFHVLIYNCGNDDRVLTAILEQMPSLTLRGFNAVVGLRDLYPEPQSRLERMRATAADILSSCPLPGEVLFAIREIEAWFIAEYSHLLRISPSLTLAKVADVLELQLDAIDVEAIEHPAGTLGQIYALAGKRYRKGKRKATLTLGALDFDEMYLNLRHSVPSLGEFLAVLEAFFANPTND